MWIQVTNTDSAGNPVTRRLRHPSVDEDVEFSENGKAQVTAEVGEQLVEQVPAIEAVEAASSSDESDESPAEGDTSDDE